MKPWDAQHEALLVHTVGINSICNGSRHADCLKMCTLPLLLVLTT